MNLRYQVKAPPWNTMKQIVISPLSCLHVCLIVLLIVFNCHCLIVYMLLFEIVYLMLETNFWPFLVVSSGRCPSSTEGTWASTSRNRLQKAVWWRLLANFTDRYMYIYIFIYNSNKTSLFRRSQSHCEENWRVSKAGLITKSYNVSTMTISDPGYHSPCCLCC